MWGGDGATSRPGVGALALAFYDKAPLIAIHRAKSTAPGPFLRFSRDFPENKRKSGAQVVATTYI